MRRVARILMWIVITLLAVVVIGGVIFALLPRGPEDLMEYEDTAQQPRPMVEGQEQVVVAGTPWAAEAAMEILDNGGNAFDAAVAALLTINVTFGEAASFPSVSPLVLYDAETQTVHSYVGVGTAPQAANIDFFRERGYEVMPEMSILSQLLPASPDTIVALLRDYGTMSFAEVSAPAIKIAREGFPFHKSMQDNLSFSLVERIGLSILLPYNGQVYLRGQWWDELYLGDRMRREDLARALEELANAETAAVQAGGTREEGLQAVRDYFYEGPIAEAIVKVHEEQGGLFTMEDLANYSSDWEEPVTTDVNEYTLYTNGPWNQGIVVLEALNILEGIDLAAMGHNSPEYVHTVAQAIELAMADRDAYAGDPAFVDVPLDVLTSDTFAAERRAAMTPGAAFATLPVPGDIPGATRSPYQPLIVAQAREDGSVIEIGQDTSHLAVIDKDGNAITLTPSDFPRTPMIPPYGLTLGNRMIQFRLDPNHVNHLEPGRRPRITPHAVIVYKDGEFWMAYGTPGGDTQPQALIQVFLNMTVFGMNVQEAIQAPRFRTVAFEDSFSPHGARPHTLHLESTIYQATHEQLTAWGYTVNEYEDWHMSAFGAVGAVVHEGDTFMAGSDPRENTWALGR